MSSTAPKSSPVSRAAGNTLDLFHDEGEIGRGRTEELSSCHVFSYREDFDYLWGIGGYENKSVVEDARASEQEVSIVLVNDGIPDSPEQFAGPSLNVRDRITAYDWVVHFFLSVLDGDDAPGVRLFVLDSTPQASGDSFASQRLQSLLPLMPWVQVYRLFDDLTDLQSRLGHFGVGFGNLAADMMGGDVDPLSSVDEDTSDNAETLIRETWVNNLTRPEGRHDVSNLVAPLVLAEGLGRATDIIQNDSRRTALAKLLRTLGVLKDQSDGEGQVQSPLETEMVENNIFGQFDHVRFLLLDDQAALGYHDILASLLFGDNAVQEEVEREGECKSVSSDDSGSLRSITDPRPLVEALFEVTGLSGESEKEVEWSQPRVLDSLSAGEDEDDGEFDVLLLDLRLFGAESDSDQDEFLSRLVEFYKHSGVESLNDDQLGFAFKAAQEYDTEEDNAAGLMHLALLPLLLSHVDPSLPIVLFSSTRQQAVTEALAHRPNIITSFRKPVVSGYHEEVSASGYAAILSEALTEALRLHEARCVWSRLVSLEWRAHPAVRMNTSEGPEQFNVPGEADGDGSDKVELPVGLTTEKLRADLALYYQKYIQKSSFVDFSSCPWEYFENHFTPKDVANSNEYPDVEIISIDYNHRYWLYNILKSVRHKKNHGYMPSVNEHDQTRATKRRYEVFSILLFEVFIDWIGEVDTMKDKKHIEVPGINRAWDHVRSVMGLDPRVFTSARSPLSTSSSKDLDGLDFLVYSCVYYWNRYYGFDEMSSTNYNTLGRGSKKTDCLVAKICRRLLEFEEWEVREISSSLKVDDEGKDSSIEVASESSLESEGSSSGQYSISLGREGSVSEAESLVAESLDPSPDRVSVRRDKDYDLLFAKVEYHDSKEGLCAYRKSDGEISYKGSTCTITTID